MIEHRISHQLRSSPELICHVDGEENPYQVTWRVHLSIPSHGWTSDMATWVLNMRPRSKFPRDLPPLAQADICALIGCSRSRLIVDGTLWNEAWEKAWGWTGAKDSSFHALVLLGDRLRVVGQIMRGQVSKFALQGDHHAARGFARDLSWDWPEAIAAAIIEMSDKLPKSG